MLYKNVVEKTNENYEKTYAIRQPGESKIARTKNRKSKMCTLSRSSTVLIRMYIGNRNTYDERTVRISRVLRSTSGEKNDPGTEQRKQICISGVNVKRVSYRYRQYRYCPIGKYRRSFKEVVRYIRTPSGPRAPAGIVAGPSKLS